MINKNKILVSIFLTFVIVFISCNSEIDSFNENSLFKIRKVVDLELKKSIINSFKQSQLQSNFYKTENKTKFDFDNILEVKDLDGNITYVVKDVENQNHGLGIYPINDDFKFIENNVKIDGEIREIEYFSLETQETLKIIFDTNKETITVTSYYNKSLRKDFGDVGDCTLACMKRIYTEMGWTSVVGWVLGAFAPESVAAVAAGCALGCSGEIDK